MIITETGKIGQNQYMLGHPTFPVYLLDGSCPVIFDGGISIMGPRYVEELKTVLKKREPGFLLLTHAHYDHCGSVAFLKKAFPKMEVVASDRAQKILQRPNALKLIDKLNQQAQSLAGGLGVAPPYARFAPFSIDRIVKEGDILRISETLSIRVIETPGHTRDSLSFFVQEEKMLVPAEALGVPNVNGYITADFLAGYAPYIASMKKLQRLEPEVLCLAHYKTFCGPDARTYIEESFSQCREFVALVKSLLREEKDRLDRVIPRIKAIEFDGKREDIQTEEAYCLNLTARIKAVMADNRID